MELKQITRNTRDLVVIQKAKREALTWGTRLIVYTYVDTNALLTVLANLSKKERKHIADSYIVGNRHITFDLPTNTVYR